jgi:hypothetical protein
MHPGAGEISHAARDYAGVPFGALHRTSQQAWTKQSMLQ